VAGADGDGERVAPGALHEFDGLIGVGVDRVFGRDLVLDARQLAQFGLDPHALVVGVFDHAAGDGDVLLVGQVRTVDHDGGEAAVDARLADVEVLTVVEVQHHRQVGVKQGGFDELDDVILARILARARRYLKDERGAFFGPRLHDALYDFHVVHVEGANGVAFTVGPCEHLSGTGQRHMLLLGVGRRQTRCLRGYATAARGAPEGSCIGRVIIHHRRGRRIVQSRRGENSRNPRKNKGAKGASITRPMEVHLASGGASRHLQAAGARAQAHHDRGRSSPRQCTPMRGTAGRCGGDALPGKEVTLPPFLRAGERPKPSLYVV